MRRKSQNGYKKNKDKMQLMPNLTNYVRFKAKFSHYMHSAVLLTKLLGSGSLLPESSKCFLCCFRCWEWAGDMFVLPFYSFSPPLEKHFQLDTRRQKVYGKGCFLLLFPHLLEILLFPFLLDDCLQLKCILGKAHIPLFKTDLFANFCLEHG